MITPQSINVLRPGCNAAARMRCRLVVLALVAAFAIPLGCARQPYLARRSAPFNPLTTPLKLVSRSGPAPTDRTQLLLRRYDLARLQDKRPGDVLAQLQEQLQQEPSADKMYSYAELAFIHGKKLELEGKDKDALDQYGASVAHAYLYLFDPNLDLFRNPYDPQFRRACDLYNGGLEAAMRLVNKQKRLRPGELHVIQTGKKQFHVEVAVRGPWREEDFDRLEFVSEFEIQGGLSHHHHTYGLGVPMIAVRRKGDETSPAEKFYPPGLSFAATAFLRVMPDTQPSAGSDVHRCVLELYDPLMSHDIRVSDRLVPLETDLSTPLAHFLDDPAFLERDNATFGLLNPAEAQGIKGLYMLEPYDPKRIPVIMVHGLWSSPTTWMDMFNDLRFFPEIRNRFQFWFFQYPSGQPFWISSVQLREALADVRQTLDPQQRNANLDQLVLVGHSMGGLVSKMQTLESGDDFWHILSEKPFEELNATVEERTRLAKVVYFHPNPSVTRVVTIGTPHRGSEFANDYARLIGRKFITLPEKMLELNNKLVRDNKDFFRSTDVLTTTTSIDSLSPTCPIFDVMLAAQKSPTTKYHNIIGVLPQDDFLGRISEEGDGIVGKQSAHLDDVVSEIAVPADHINVHRHPLAVLEVRRVLLEHLLQSPANALATDMLNGGVVPLPSPERPSPVYGPVAAPQDRQPLVGARTAIFRPLPQRPAALTTVADDLLPLPSGAYAAPR